MNSISRVIVSFVFAAFVAALALSIGTAIYERDSSASVFDSLALIHIYFPAAAVVTLLGGVPAFMILNAYRAVRWWSAITGGGAVGALAATLIFWSSKNTLSILVPVAVAGMLGGLAFWISWRSAPDSLKGS